jgi:hypothetical protein
MDGEEVMPGIHDCEPPTERRPLSEPREWKCPECGAWWDIDPANPPLIAPPLTSDTNEGIVRARWVRRATTDDLLKGGAFALPQDSAGQDAAAANEANAEQEFNAFHSQQP